MKPFASRAVAVCVLLALATPTIAQPSLTSLWPVDVGRSWVFDVRVEGPFNEVATGVITQTVSNQRELSSGVTASCFDVASTVPPGVRGPLPSVLLAVPGCAFDIGVSVDEEVATGVWSDVIADWGWWWIPADPVPGSSFRLPIRTEVAEDAFVNGEVRTISGVVSTPAGLFTNAVIVDYLVEMGESEFVDAGSGEVLGTASFETVGWVAFVPGVGPVASEETIEPTEFDCPECPREFQEAITTTMALLSAIPVSAEQLSFGTLKDRFSTSP